MSDEEGLREPVSKVFAFAMIAMCIVGFIFYAHFTVNKEPLTDAERHKQRIQGQFSAWDGSHRNLTDFIKRSMHNPASYEHVTTRYVNKGDHLIIVTSFRGTNAFGGVVQNTLTAKADLDGQIIDVLEQK